MSNEGEDDNSVDLFFSNDVTDLSTSDESLKQTNFTIPKPFDQNEAENEHLVHLIISNDVENLSTFDERLKQTNFSFPKPFNQNETDETIPKQELGLIHIAAYFDCLESLFFLEKIVKIDLLSTTSNNYNVLHYACAGNAIEVASYVLYKHPELAKSVTDTKLQYIYLAVIGGSPNILKLLFKKGAIIKYPAVLANKPITKSIKRKDVKCLQILLKNTTKSLVNTELNTLMIAIEYGLVEAIPLLLDSGIDLSERTSKNITALALNCFTICDVNVTKMICDRMNDIDIPPTIHGIAAVHWLCMSKNPEIASIMLKKGIDVNRFDHEGKPGPFYLIDITTDDIALQIMELLYKYGYILDLRYSEKHNTILGGFINAIATYPKVIDWLISNGASIDLPFYSLVQTTTIRYELLTRPEYQSICIKYGIYPYSVQMQYTNTQPN